MNFHRQRWRRRQLRRWRQKHYHICLVTKIFLAFIIALFVVIYIFCNLPKTKEISEENIINSIANVTEIGKFEAKKEDRKEEEPKEPEITHTTAEPKEAPKKKRKKYKKVEELIAKHMISYPGAKNDTNRNHNLALAASIINKATGGKKGYILNPGEKFSWLEIVGNPTKKKGFKKAGTIINQKPAKDWGGGVCQISSTIYSTISKTEQEMDKEHLLALQHSVESTYLRPNKGDKEATVTFSGKKDFWFISTFENPIRIFIKTGAGTVTVKIYEIKKIPIEEVE